MVDVRAAVLAMPLTAATKRLKPKVRALRDDAWRYRAMMELAAYGVTAASVMADQIVEMLSRRTDGLLGVLVSAGDAEVMWMDRPGMGFLPVFGLVDRVLGNDTPSYQPGGKCGPGPALPYGGPRLIYG